MVANSKSSSLAAFFICVRNFLIKFCFSPGVNSSGLIANKFNCSLFEILSKMPFWFSLSISSLLLRCNNFSLIGLLMPIGVILCSKLYFSCTRRRRVVSLMAKSIDFVVLSA